MNLKMRRSKTSYTIMIVSDSAKNYRKQFHIKAGAVGAVTGVIFAAVVLIICYMVYSSITLSDSVERTKKQMEQINLLKEEKAQLETSNEELIQKVAILSETVNQKVEVEQALAAQQEEGHLPKGFPLSGSAQIKSEGVEETREDGEEDQAAEQETAAAVGNTDRKEVVFTAATGAKVIASGAGNVIEVIADIEYGNSISIDHGNGYVTIYRNGGNPLVKVGDEVMRGAILYVISEGNVDMGYSIKQENTYIDPMEMIEING